MKREKNLLHRLRLLALPSLLAFVLSSACVTPSYGFSIPNPVGELTNPLKSILSDIANKYVTDPATTAAQSATQTAIAAANHNYDSVATEVIEAMAARTSLKPFIAALESKIVPKEIQPYSQGFAAVLTEIDKEIVSFKKETYRSLYATYKNDIRSAARSIQSGDFSEFYRYCLFYGIATADWSSPDAAKASALNIAKDQYALYQWYSSHTMKGAVISVAKTQAGSAGLTDEAIAAGVKGIANQFQNTPKEDNAMLGALIAAQFALFAKEEQCSGNKIYCSRQDQRLCGASSEQHTVSVRNRLSAPLLAKVHVVANQSHCENHVCDMSGILQPGESRMCAVYGQWDTNKVEIYVQAWDPRGSSANFTPHPYQSEFLPIIPEDGGNPAVQEKFNKSASNSIDIGYSANGEFCIGCGYPQVVPRSYQWLNQPPPPAGTIQDARGQLVCAPKDRPGIGRAFRGGDGRWYCQFGHNGQEHTYGSNFVFLQLPPGNQQWVAGKGQNAVGAFMSPDFPVCRANPGGGWPHKEFGWVYQEGCILGWGGSSPTIPQYESLIAPR